MRKVVIACAALAAVLFTTTPLLAEKLADRKACFADFFEEKTRLKAIKACTRLLGDASNDPIRGEILTQRGRMYQSQKQYKEAAEDHEAAIPELRDRVRVIHYKFWANALDKFSPAAAARIREKIREIEERK